MQFQCKITENISENGFTDDDGGKADDDGAAAHVDLGIGIILAQQCA